jgi:Domain of unknown function (DUF4145)
LKCPHCLTSFHSNPLTLNLGDGDKQFYWAVLWEKCPACEKFVVALSRSPSQNFNPSTSFIVYPKAVARKPTPIEVPQKVGDDYKEACLVFADSPKASAALSRRCLQTILREHARVKPQDLSKEIDDVLASKQLPTYIAEDIDAIRHVGNFAAHPMKSTNTGEIVDVEPGEADWLLNVLEELFDHYFVGPAQAKKKRDALNAKLADLRKPPLKKP